MSRSAIDNSESAVSFVTMHESSSVELARDCEAVQIPVGQTVLLPAGTSVSITQTLGGAYTVQALGGLFRIADHDADALGISATPPGAGVGAGELEATEAGPVDEPMVWEALRSCYDPEIPVNIVDLGLVYDLQIEALPSGRSRIAVKMTLTAPGCGMGSVIAGDAEQKLRALSGVDDARVEVVWDPPWHHSMISPAGRARLGLD